MAMHAAESLKFAHTAEAPHASNRPEPVASTVAEFERSKGGVPEMTFSDWLEYARANWKKEEGQTMAEYGVVLAVITVGIVGALTILSDGIRDAITNVVGRL